MLVSIASSSALGTCVTYLTTAGTVTIWSWRGIFWISGILLLCSGIWWIYAITKVENYGKLHGEAVTADAAPEAPQETLSVGKLFLMSGGFIILVPTIILGMLRDGVMTWAPEYAASNLGSSNAMSIFLTALLPLVNLSGAYIVHTLSKRISSEPVIVAILFSTAGIATTCIMLLGNRSLLLTMLLFSMITSSMAGCGIVMINLMPTYFVKWGRTCTVSGLLNSVCYAGSALSGSIIGILSESFGWTAAQIFWLALSIVALTFCFLAAPVWKKFKESAL